MKKITATTIEHNAHIGVHTCMKTTTTTTTELNTSIEVLFIIVFLVCRPSHIVQFIYDSS